MDCKKEIFVDGIGQIHFTGGMVRFDFVTLQPKEGGTPDTEVIQRDHAAAGLPEHLQLDAAADRQAGRSRRAPEERKREVISTGNFRHVVFCELSVDEGRCSGSGAVDFPFCACSREERGFLELSG